jgi:hypothetical protein
MKNIAVVIGRLHMRPDDWLNNNIPVRSLILLVIGAPLTTLVGRKDIRGLYIELFTWLRLFLLLLSLLS